MGLRDLLRGGRRAARANPDAGAPPSATPGGGDGVRGARDAAWRTASPISRVVAQPGLVCDPAGFRAGLETWQDPSFRRPLRHLVSDDAPAGVMHGLLDPAGRPAPAGGAPAPARAPALPLARQAGEPEAGPVQRLALGGAAGPLEAAAVASSPAPVSPAPVLPVGVPPGPAGTATERLDTAGHAGRPDSAWPAVGRAAVGRTAAGHAGPTSERAAEEPRPRVAPTAAPASRPVPARPAAPAGVTVQLTVARPVPAAARRVPTVAPPAEPAASAGATAAASAAPTPERSHVPATPESVPAPGAFLPTFDPVGVPRRDGPGRGGGPENTSAPAAADRPLAVHTRPNAPAPQPLPTVAAALTTATPPVSRVPSGATAPSAAGTGGAASDPVRSSRTTASPHSGQAPEQPLGAAAKPQSAIPQSAKPQPQAASGHTAAAPAVQRAQAGVTRRSRPDRPAGTPPGPRIGLGEPLPTLPPTARSAPHQPDHRELPPLVAPVLPPQDVSHVPPVSTVEPRPGVGPVSRAEPASHPHRTAPAGKPALDAPSVSGAPSVSRAQPGSHSEPGSRPEPAPHSQPVSPEPVTPAPAARAPSVQLLAERPLQRATLHPPATRDDGPAGPVPPARPEMPVPTPARPGVDLPAAAAPAAPLPTSDRPGSTGRSDRYPPQRLRVAAVQSHARPAGSTAAALSPERDRTGPPGRLGHPAPPPVQRLPLSADRGQPAASDPGPLFGGSTPPSLIGTGPGASAVLPDAGAIAVAAGIATRAADGSVVFAPPGAPPASRPTTPVQRAPVQRALGSPVLQPPVQQPLVSRQGAAQQAPPQLALVQRAPLPQAPVHQAPVYQAPVPQAPVHQTAAQPAPARQATAPAPGATVQRRSISTPPAPESSSAGDARLGLPTTPAQLDELARRLLGPMSRLLRAEMRASRERSGRLLDGGR